MTEFAFLYSVEASHVEGDVEMIGMGAPFVALSDEAAIGAVANTIRDLIENSGIDVDIVKDHRIVCLGKFFPSRKRPIVLNSGDPYVVMECSALYEQIVEKEKNGTDA